MKMIRLAHKADMSQLKHGDALLVENHGCRLMIFHLAQTPNVNEKEMVLHTTKEDVWISVDRYLAGESNAENIYLLIREEESE
jgi:hypothetical protein